MHPQVLDACFSLDLMFFENDPRVLKGSPVRDQQSLVFSGAIFRPLLSNQRITRHKISLILSSRIPMSSAAHTTSALSAKPMMLIPAGSSKRRKSSYVTFQTSGPTRDPWRAPHVISSLRDHVTPSYITHLLLSHLWSAAGGLEPSSAPSPRCRSSISRYWTHYVCQCWSMRRIPYAYQFLFVHLWRCLSQLG